MSTTATLTFPTLLFLNDYNGNFSDYFNAVYKVFENDFIKSQPKYNQLVVSAPKYPLHDGIHRTFYHITHEGDDEQNREPDFRRMERIRFPRFIIDNCPHNQLLVWEKEIGRDTRIHILNETEQYLVVLTRRDSYLLLWTAFFIEHKHTLNKKRKEYEAYKNTKTA
jgi:hypothetical protein